MLTRWQPKARLSFQTWETRLSCDGPSAAARWADAAAQDAAGSSAAAFGMLSECCSNALAQGRRTASCLGPHLLSEQSVSMQCSCPSLQITAARRFSQSSCLMGY